MPESAIGFFSDAGMTHVFPRIVNNEISFGLYLALTGNRMKGKDLVKWGFATHYVEDENLEPLKQAIIERVSRDTTDEEIYAIVSEFASLGSEYPNIDRQALTDRIEHATYIG